MDHEEYQLMYSVEDFHWWYVGMRRITDNLLALRLDKARPQRILDAGCGTGGNLPFLKKYGSVVGIDIATEAMEFTALRAPEHLLRGSITGLPFAAASFDLVTSFDVIYHLDVTDDLAALREFYRVLRPGGFLLIRAPAYDFLRGSHDKVVHTRQRYTKGLLRQRFTQAGFRSERLTYANSLLFPIAAMKRLYEWRRSSWNEARSDIHPPAPVVNRLLTSVLSVEAAFIRAFSLPAGLSIIGLAQKAP